MARWYIIHAYSGFEGKVRDQIMADATRLGLDRLVEAVEVPTETVTEVRRGKKIQSERKPQPISEAEAARILNTKEEAASAAPKARVHVDYDIGDTVKVTSGNFATFSGVVEELDFDKSRVKVSISIFGRATPLELGFEDVERVK